MLDFTLEELSDFTKNEEKMVKDLFPALDTVQQYEPSDELIDRILDFSRAYSVRRSEKVQFIRMVLN